MHLDSGQLLTLAVAFLLGVIAVGRATRLVVHDDWPPMVWARQRFRHAVSYGPWEGLVTCPFCFAPYAAAVNLTWGWFALDQPGAWWATAWWAVNLWAAGSYLAAMLVARDEPEDD